MNRYLLKIGSFFVCISLLVMTVSAASISDKQLQNKPSVAELVDNILGVKTVEEDGNQVKHIYNIQRLRDSIKKNNPLMSDVELAKAIRIATGEDPNIVEGMDQNAVVAALNYQEIVQKEDYICVNNNGEQTYLSKEQCMQEVSEAKKLKVMQDIAPINSYSETSIRADKEETYPFDNGYMRITTRASRIAKHNTGDETWLVSGLAEWLKVPYWKLNDMITISSSALYDSDYSSYESGYMYCYKRCDGMYGNTKHSLNGGHYYTTQKTYESNYGISYSCKMNGAGQYGCVDDFETASYHFTYEFNNVEYFGQYCVNTKRTDNFNVLVGYGHARVTGQVSATVTGGPDITFSFGTEEYISRPLLVKPQLYK